MASSEWALVLFGVAVAVSGSWLQFHPERIFPMPSDWRPEASALAQVRMLGGCFVFMGAFFATQMAIILAHQPWWIGPLAGLPVAILAVTLLGSWARRHSSLAPPLDDKALQVR